MSRFSHAACAFLVVLATLVATTARAQPAMWVARGPHATVYFIGTIHALKPGFTWDARQIDRVLGHVQELWTELGLDIDTREIVDARARLGLDPQRSLKAHLAPQDYAALIKLRSAVKLPGDVADIEAMRPWLAYTTLETAELMQAGFSAAAGVDIAVMRKARLAQVPIYGLETAVDQMRALAAAPDEVWLTAMHPLAVDPRAAARLTDALAARWAAGDESGMDAVAMEMKSSSPDMFQTVVTERNERWSRRLAVMINAASGNAVMAVGALHLAGPDSVIAKLRAQGITIERLAPDAP